MLERIETVDLNSAEAISIVEDLLADTGHDYSTDVYSSLHAACWFLITTFRPGDAHCRGWRNVFLKATVLLRAGGRKDLASRAFVLSDMMAISMRQSESSIASSGSAC